MPVSPSSIQKGINVAEAMQAAKASRTLVFKAKPEFTAQKGLTVEVINMSPDEYLEKANAASLEGFSPMMRKTAEQLRMNYRPEKLSSIRKAAAEGTEVPMPFLEMDTSGKVIGQDGRHRAFVAKEQGLKTIPVAVIKESKADEIKKPKWINIEE